MTDAPSARTFNIHLVLTSLTMNGLIVQRPYPWKFQSHWTSNRCHSLTWRRQTRNCDIRSVEHCHERLWAVSMTTRYRKKLVALARYKALLWMSCTTTLVVVDTLTNAPYTIDLFVQTDRSSKRRSDKITSNFSLTSIINVSLTELFSVTRFCTHYITV